MYNNDIFPTEKNPHEINFSIKIIYGIQYNRPDFLQDTE